MTVNEEELYARAVRAMYTTARREGAAPQEPSRALSTLETLNDKQYMVLRNANGILAVYRVRRDGALKRLKRWPSELEGEA